MSVPPKSSSESLHKSYAFPKLYALEKIVVYMAGRLFTLAEIEFNAHLAAELRAIPPTLTCTMTTGALGEKQLEILLPQETEVVGKSAKEIFEMDVKQIDQANIVVANMSDPILILEHVRKLGMHMPKVKRLSCSEPIYEQVQQHLKLQSI
jgi:hypothetical protein